MREILTQTQDKVRLFQLYLLSFMRVSGNTLANGLERLNSKEAELETVKTSMKGRGFEAIGGPDVQFYRELLGLPVSEDPEELSYMIPKSPGERSLKCFVIFDFNLLQLVNEEG